MKKLKFLNADLLHSSRSDNFIKEQPGRFELLAGKHCTVGTMYFCHTYLDACFLAELEDGVAIYWDTAIDPGDKYSSLVEHYVVVSKKKFTF